MNDFVKFAYKKYGLVIHGSGGGFMNQINQIDMYFYIKEELSISQMRSLLINLTNDFLEQINAGEKSKDYLAVYPFEFNRLHFSVVIYNKDRKRIVNPGNSKEKITFAFTKNNKLFYFIINEEQDHYQKIFEDNYEEALKIVNLEN